MNALQLLTPLWGSLLGFLSEFQEEAPLNHAICISVHVTHGSGNVHAWSSDSAD